MDVTKLSTKGQVVIPDDIRKDIPVGTPFLVTRSKDLIVLKSVTGLSKEEKKEMEELNKIWKDIDAGKGVTMKAKDFLKEMQTW